MKLKRPAS